MAITLPSIAAATVITAACDKQPEIRIEDFRGAMVTPSVPKVDFTLTDQYGEPFSFREETDGFATLLFFGYTFCPDVCPLHMAQIAAALEQLGDETAEQLKVVFVSVDPDRDSPERLREWLGAFHQSFIGLTGPIEQINQIQLEMRFRPGTVEEIGDNYGVTHSSAVVGFTRDGEGRFFYLSGTRTEDYVNDIPLLIGFAGET